MNLLDIFEGREPYQQAIDKLEQRRIKDLEARMDDCARRGDKAGFQKCKTERDSYYKAKELKELSPDTLKSYMNKSRSDQEKHQDNYAFSDNNDDAYRSIQKEKRRQKGQIRAQHDLLQKGEIDEGSMKHMMHKDAERMSREKFCDTYGDEHGEFWDNINLDEAVIGQDIVNKSEKMARATPQTKAGAVASTVKNAAKWLAGKGGPGREGPTYEGIAKSPVADKQVKVFKDKSGEPIGEIGIDGEASPGNGNWYVAYYATGYDAGGFDSYNEALEELQYIADEDGIDLREGAEDIEDRGEYDREGDMAKDNIHTIVRNARELESVISDNDNLPEWVQDKLANVKGMITAVSEYMQTQHERDHDEGVTIAEKLKGLSSKKLGSARDVGKSVKKFRAQRGLDEAGTDSQWSKESDWKKIPKAKSGKPADPRGEVTHLSDVARREAERKAAQKKNSEKVDEGWQDFNKVEPYAVCLAGKPVKKFDYYEQARRFHDNWKQKLYREGNKEKADKITLLPLGLDEVDEAQDWQGNYGAGQAETTDHTMDEAIEYVKGNYPFSKKYRVRRAEPGFRANQDSTEFNRSHAHVTDVDSAMDYLQLKENPVMSGSKQISRSLGYSWHTNENRGSGIAVFYYEDRGMGWDEILVAAKDKKNLASAVQVFRDAGVVPELKKKVKEDDPMGGATVDIGQMAGADCDTNPGNMDEAIEENLKKWFKEKWVRFGPDGKIRGDCARGSETEGKPKCLPQSKAHALGKKGRASSAAKKRREDPNPERRGPAKNVATKVSEAIPKKDLLARLEKELNSDEFKNSPVDPNRKGWTGPKKNDPYYTKNFGHGYPNTPDNRSHDRDVRKSLKKDDLDENCWKGYHKEGNKELFGKTVPNCVKNEAVAEGIPFDQCPKCGGAIVHESQLSEKQDACYHKVKSRYKVWPSAYASGALVQCRKKGAANWGNKSKNESAEQELDEKWSQKYKSSINCSNPKGFSQKAHCAGRKKNEGMFSSLEENNEARDAVESAIIRRIMVAHKDLLMKFGPQKVMQAAEAIADEHTDVEEIGTSDVSAYVQQVERYLAMNY